MNRAPADSAFAADAASAAARKSPMSLPAVKTPGDPVSRIAPTFCSRLASSKASINRSYIALVSAFFFSGRASVTQETAPSRRT